MYKLSFFFFLLNIQINNPKTINYKKNFFVKLFFLKKFIKLVFFKKKKKKFLKKKLIKMMNHSFFNIKFKQPNTTWEQLSHFFFKKKPLYKKKNKNFFHIKKYLKFKKKK